MHEAPKKYYFASQERDVTLEELSHAQLIQLCQQQEEDFNALLESNRRWQSTLIDLPAPKHHWHDSNAGLLESVTQRIHAACTQPTPVGTPPYQHVDTFRDCAVELLLSAQTLEQQAMASLTPRQREDWQLARCAASVARINEGHCGTDQHYRRGAASLLKAASAMTGGHQPYVALSPTRKTADGEEAFEVVWAREWAHSRQPYSLINELTIDEICGVQTEMKD